MPIHHLNCATFCPYGARLLSGTGPLFGEGRLVCHCLLVETSAGLLLVDTGLGTRDLEDPHARLGGAYVRLVRPRLDPEETAVRQLARLGYAAKDVRHIVLTHGDLDHAGGLADFPEAEVHLFAEEHRAITERPTTMEAQRYRALQWAHGPKWRPHPLAGDRWEGFEAVRPIPGLDPEVALIPLPGHTRGHTAVAVRDGGRWLLHAGDAYFFGGQMDPERPHIPRGLALFQRAVDFDHRLRVQNQERLRQLAKARRPEIEVFCAHDPA